MPSAGQGWVAVVFAASQPGGTIVPPATTTGTQIASYQSTKTFKGVVFSSSQITAYAIYTGGTHSGTQATIVTAGTQTSTTRG